MALTTKQRTSILNEIANVIVFSKTNIVACMSKSNITTVTTETSNTVLGNQVIENLIKNTAFKKNLASMITDINLTNLLESKSLNSTGDSSQIGAEFGQKIESIVAQLSLDIGSSAKSKETIKGELAQQIADVEKEKAQVDKDEKLEKRFKTWSTIGITLLLLGAISLVSIGRKYYKKHQSE